MFYQVPNEIFFTEQRKRIVDVIKKGSVRVVSDPEDLEQIYSYIVYEYKEPFLVLHYAHTKKPYRQWGLLNLLLSLLPEAAMVMHTYRANNNGFKTDHITKKIQSKYNPYLFLGRGV